MIDEANKKETLMWKPTVHVFEVNGESFELKQPSVNDTLQIIQKKQNF